MINHNILEIIQKEKKELEEIWYNISDENIEYITNWFINIANSMITEDIREIPNFKNNKLINSLIYDIPVFKEAKIEKMRENYKLYENSNNHNDFITNVINRNKLYLENKYKKLLELIGENNNKQIDKKNIIKIKKILLKNKVLLDKFNKGKLSNIENQIIIKLLKND